MQAGDGRDTRFRVESLAGIALIGTLVSIYMASQTLRNSIGVIAPDLARDLDLSAAQLGILSSIFFVGFVAMQIPLGLALDRFGPKRCMIACTGVVIIGTGLFALAPTAGALIAARALIGVGSSCYLMAPLAFYARRFPPERFALLAGVQMGLGTVGTLLATAPLAFSATAFGWRATFWLIAGVMAAGGLLVALVVPGDRSAPLAPPEPLSRSLAGTLQAIRLPYVTALFMMQLAAYSTFALIVGLWGGPYLTHVYGYGLVERGDLLFIAAGGQVIGLLANGPLERRIGGYKTVVVLGALASAALLLVLAATGSLPRGLLVAWLFAFGLASAFTPAL
ncbi:MAG: MFS transporter, partial [Rhizobiales bacterium]|nr:MFS transporter [Hyphomicrobiales bacterium]